MQSPGARTRTAGNPEGRSVVRQAMLRFAVWTVLATSVLGAATVVISGRIAEEQALRQASQQTSHVAGVVADIVDRPLRVGHPPSVARLETVVMPLLAEGSLTHVKLWSADGTIFWADQPGLIGRRFNLEPEIRDLFGSTAAVASVSKLDETENATERRAEELLEIYVGISDTTGRHMVFEAYLSAAPMRRNQEATIAAMLPLSLGGILLFELAVLPLAVSLARRVDRAQAERGSLLRHSLAASELERRRIAQDLHDGVIQDLAGLGYTMPVVAEQLPQGPQAQDAREAVALVAQVLERDVLALRALLTDIYPPNLETGGLLAAVEELAAGAEDAQVSVSVQVTPEFHAPIDAARLAYRVVREGLRNVLRHSGSATAQVHLLRRGDDVVVRVVDAGQGPASGGAATADGHLGLRLLDDTVRDLGGRLDLSPGAQGGAILEAVFPAELLAP